MYVCLYVCPFALGALMPTNSSNDASTPQSPQVTTTADGFVVGGTRSTHVSKVRSKYPTKKSTGASSRDVKDMRDMGGIDSPYRKNNTFGESSFGNEKSIINGKMVKENVQSFVLNSEMKSIRLAEAVIMKDEKKFGRMDRDPLGRIIPVDQVCEKNRIYLHI
jgi:hypothetical protein